MEFIAILLSHTHTHTISQLMAFLIHFDSFLENSGGLPGISSVPGKSYPGVLWQIRYPVVFARQHTFLLFT